MSWSLCRSFLLHPVEALNLELYFMCYVLWKKIYLFIYNFTSSCTRSSYFNCSLKLPRFIPISVLLTLLIITLLCFSSVYLGLPHSLLSLGFYVITSLVICGVLSIACLHTVIIIYIGQNKSKIKNCLFPIHLYQCLLWIVYLY